MHRSIIIQRSLVLTYLLFICLACISNASLLRQRTRRQNRYNKNNARPRNKIERQIQPKHPSQSTTQLGTITMTHATPSHVEPPPLHITLRINKNQNKINGRPIEVTHITKVENNETEHKSLNEQQNKIESEPIVEKHIAKIKLPCQDAPDDYYKEDSDEEDPKIRVEKLALKQYKYLSTLMESSAWDSTRNICNETEHKLKKEEKKPPDDYIYCCKD